MPRYENPQLEKEYQDGRTKAIEYAESRVRDSIVADDIPDDLSDNENVAWHNGWNSTIRQARVAAVAAIETLRVVD